ncbi:bifunctional hydroxymethylpyrimidine kinase/phosphomethylpyrimidine kinase [Rhodoblastus sphagnicola]|uniref:hydroxymethylpyrimidine kinase n=1 Tax=Rhodoblastus sphagnicola TaxID=333368 RepID=A0A2S6N5H2_9HYPH|nr:bifunctional hydroxymethylpyrimidine kinase/phosphomethylpyrimidine kinase [Rhodoblastus sphagnicola]MBB4197258.1 hydroxymethylpyrimidine/phosphomethylpyrimidine kinase [Rhodoblastus sphagnicola]PPQ29864.1 bifunctional hydroxymethylpyrimidine kinase/phosphomethylpyrimidine kinase [Rhodoblastus sphagnicola]
MAYAKILSIAGSDPSGGAGIQADLKTFAAFGCYGMAAISALTAQNTRGVQAVSVVPADFVKRQIESVFADIAVDAVKIGMIGGPANAFAIAEALAGARAKNIVLDPVLVATSGDALGGPAMRAPLQKMLPLARLTTPNLVEAAILADGASGGEKLARGVEDMRALALRLCALGAPAVLIKGGHLSEGDALDLLYDGENFAEFTAPRIKTRNTHGTGCALSSAIAALLGQGRGLSEAVGGAKAWLTRALQAGADVHIGAGHGPPHHFCDLWP